MVQPEGGRRGFGASGTSWGGKGGLPVAVAPEDWTLGIKTNATPSLPQQAPHLRSRSTSFLQASRSLRGIFFNLMTLTQTIALAPLSRLFLIKYTAKWGEVRRIRIMVTRRSGKSKVKRGKGALGTGEPTHLCQMSPLRAREWGHNCPSRDWAVIFSPNFFKT